MNIWDWLYLMGRPLTYVSLLLGLYRIVKTRSTKGFSLTAWAMGTIIVLATFIRSLFSLHDLIFWTNAAFILAISFVELGLIWKWRHK